MILSPFFRPRAIAVVGASDRPASVGRGLFQNLIRNPSGIPIYPVNPNRAEVGGHPAFADLGKLPAPVDLAIIAVPAPSVPALVGQCAVAGIPAALILTAGFRETGEEGARLEREVLERAAGKVRIIGPNCLGFMNPKLGLNASFAGQTARPGNLAFLSQSGAMCTAILDWSLKVNIGFSGFVSTGSMLDVDFADFIEHFGADPDTRAILLYMESVGDAQAFLRAARHTAPLKPIIAIKAGRSAEAVQAVSSHTGTLAGSDAVLDAAFRRAGVQRVDSIEELFYLAEALGQQPRPRGNALAIVTNAGGPAVLSVDALIAAGGTLAPLSETTRQSLDALLPPHWSHRNPIDVIGDADAQRMVGAVRLALDDPENDGVLAILTQQVMTDPAATAAGLAGLERKDGKPLLASWMGGAGVEPGIALLNQASVPAFPFPDVAARVFRYMAEYHDVLQNLEEAPPHSLERDGETKNNAVAEGILDRARGSGRTLLTEHESKTLLQACGLSVVETRVAADEDEAVRAATACGYPVVVKLHSETLTHKSDVGGVRLDLNGAEQVREAFRAIRRAVAEKAGPGHFQGVTVQRMIRARGLELILGAHTDAQFGPVVLFGWGGIWVEALKDTALDLAPLNANLAGKLMARTRVHRALEGGRGGPQAGMAELRTTLARFSRMLVDHPRIQSIDINPFLVSGNFQAALDARVILHA